jgi:hypothetical protein
MENSMERRGVPGRSLTQIGLGAIGFWVGRRRQDRFRFVLFAAVIAGLSAYAAWKYTALVHESRSHSVHLTTNMLSMAGALNYLACSGGTVCTRVERCSDAGKLTHPQIQIRAATPEQMRDGLFIDARADIALTDTGAANTCNLYQCDGGECHEANYILIAVQ